jgi:hypothetical protein
MKKKKHLRIAETQAIVEILLENSNGTHDCIEKGRRRKRGHSSNKIK